MEASQWEDRRKLQERVVGEKARQEKTRSVWETLKARLERRSRGAG